MCDTCGQDHYEPSGIPPDLADSLVEDGYAEWKDDDLGLLDHATCSWSSESCPDCGRVTEVHSFTATKPAGDSKTYVG